MGQSHFFHTPDWSKTPGMVFSSSGRGSKMSECLANDSHPNIAMARNAPMLSMYLLLRLIMTAEHTMLSADTPCMICNSSRCRWLDSVTIVFFSVYRS
ncbi:hypothetical protein HZ326_24032 [Fusarium oxysporum f. sp. albedinis]|nr:hypothetical protein HZ326_24032 [Fusarium oxysporum f. sp. albedinis]